VNGNKFSFLFFESIQVNYQTKPLTEENNQPTMAIAAVAAREWKPRTNNNEENNILTKNNGDQAMCIVEMGGFRFVCKIE
jgi:hypothetical protein